MAETDAKTASKPDGKPDAIASVLPQGFTLALDRTRHFSEVCGDAPHNLGFLQDHIPFDKAGRLLTELFEPGNAAVLEQQYAGAKASLERKINRHLAEQKAAQAVKDGDTDNKLGEQQQHDTDPDADVNLVAWAKGELKLLPHVVYRVGQKRFGKYFPNYAALTAHMVEKKAIHPDEVKVK